MVERALPLLRQLLEMELSAIKADIAVMMAESGKIGDQRDDYATELRLRLRQTQAVGREHRDALQALTTHGARIAAVLAGDACPLCGASGDERLSDCRDSGAIKRDGAWFECPSFAKGEGREARKLEVVP